VADGQRERSLIYQLLWCLSTTTAHPATPQTRRTSNAGWA
jgi:hypothetical protein